MGVPKSRASRQVLAHFALMAPPQRTARDVSRLARLFFPQVYHTSSPLPAAAAVASPSASTSTSSAAGSSSRSLHTSAVTTPGSPTTPLFFDPSLADKAKDTGAGGDGSSAHTGSSSLPLLGPGVHHPPPGPRFKVGPRSALSNSTASDSPSSGSLPNASPSLRLIGFPTQAYAIPPLFGSVVGFKNPRRVSYTFRNGASGIAKTRNDAWRNQHKQTGSSIHGACTIGSPGQQTPTERAAETTLSVQVGEDAYFLRSDSLGVADGVGGWTGRPGADSALFSRNLMHHCALELARYDDVDSPQFSTYQDVDPVEVLQRAYERCVQEAREDGIVGSSTALLAVLRSNELRVANIGDCCCSVIRGNEYIFRSEEQQHSFNYPVQIGTNSATLPEVDAQGFTVKVQKNDIVILSSDGLVDNLFDEDILEEVLRFAGRTPPSTSYNATPAPSTGVTNAPTSPSPSHSTSASPATTSSTVKPAKTSSTIFSASVPTSSTSSLNLTAFSPQMVSEALCARAKAVSEDHLTVNSPFAQRALEEGLHHIGGKQDDISVLVAVVGHQEDTSDRR